MSGSFRFLHAGGFALDQPLHGLAEAPEALEALLIDAPFRAAQQVFDAAIEERVDFVVLNGDLIDLGRASARAIAFLLENFERLEAYNISAYWAAGSLDAPQKWPAAAKLPDRVHVFPSLEPEELSHFRGDEPIANIIGRSWHGTTTVQVGEIKSDTDGLPTLVVANGQADAERLKNQMVDYWALGGQTQRQSAGSAQQVIHYAGSPQGRWRQEPGAHGCTLVHVGGDRAVRMQFMPTDAIRWHTEQMAIEADATLESARRLLGERVKQLRAEAESRPLIVTWQIQAGHQLAGPAARRDLAAEWQAWLRKEFFLSAGKPALWTHAVELDQPELPGAWFDEDSMLGDFLRSLRELGALEPEAVDMGQHVPDHHRLPALAALTQWTKEEHDSVLSEAALTGAQLLGAGERES
jgi:calcineurin-like phosphoesterase family protein